MTILAAAYGPDGVWVGSDGLAQCNGLKTLENLPKWALSPCGKWAVGCSGSAAYQEIVSRMAPNAWPREVGKQGVDELLGQIRGEMDSAGARPIFDHDDHQVFPDYRFSPLIAGSDNGVFGLWTSCSQLIFMSPPYEFWGRKVFVSAKGSGQDMALGAMCQYLHVNSKGAKAEQAVLAGIEAAIQLSDSCGGEIWMHKMGEPVTA